MDEKDEIGEGLDKAKGLKDKAAEAKDALAGKAGEGSDEAGGLADKAKDLLGGASDKLPGCLLYTSPSPRDRQKSRMPSSA